MELGYAVFVWPRRTRALWAWLTIGLHAGIAVSMGLWSFFGVMIVLTGSAFLISAEPRPTKPLEEGATATREQRVVPGVAP